MSDLEPNTGESWLTLLRQSGEADLGAAMRRLARQAAAAHRQQLAERAAEAPSTLVAAHELDLRITRRGKEATS